MAYGSYTPAMNLYDMIGGIADPIVSNLKEADKRNTLSALGEQLQKGDFEGATAAALKAGDVGTGLKIMELGRQQKADAEAFKSLGSLGALGGAAPQQSPTSISSPANTPVLPSGQENSGLPRGLRNLNPGNIEAGSFAQSQPGYIGSDGRFARFDTLENGVNAQSSLLDSYGRKGINTVSGIVNRWAPSAENGAATGNYAAFVAKKLGVDPNAPIDIANPDTRRNVALAMAEFENGRPVRVADAGGAVPQGATGPSGEAASLLARRSNIIRALSVPGISDAARQRLDTLLKDTEFLLSRADKEANRQPMALSEGQILVDTRTGRQIAAGGQGSKLEGEVAARRRVVEAQGGDIKDPRNQQFINTGRYPREDAQPLSATDKKAIIEADDMVAQNENAISALKQAKELSKRALGFPGAGAAAKVGAVAGHEASQATVELDNVVTGQALESLKAIFGAAPTEGERAILLQIQGSSSQPDAIRQKIFDRAISLASRRLEFNRQRATDMRGGDYYKPRGGKSGALKAAPEQEISGARRALEAGVPREAVVKQLRDLGFDASGL